MPSDVSERRRMVKAFTEESMEVASEHPAQQE